jgi:aspartyl-tRNA(Asn)/glutamyl-tRNA(Gln) amidotransferase subunit C
MIDRATVEKIAKLARLELPEEEIGKFTRQLNDILGYVEKLNQLDTSAIEATSHAVEVPNPMREDEVHPTNVVDKILEISPDREENFFRVPKVI